MEQILKVLERDGRLTPEQIATQTGRTVDEVRSIIAEAEGRHVIADYGAHINWEAAGQERVYAQVEIKAQPQEGVGYNAIAGRIARFDQVRSCYLTSGAYDLSVLVAGKSIHEISDFVGEKLATMQGVQSTVTHVIMRRYKEDGVVLQGAKDNDRQAVVL